MRKYKFDVFGTSSDIYAGAIEDLFNETYFLEGWITDLLVQKKLTSDDEVLLGKLARISKFIHESVLGIVLSDIQVLLGHYYYSMSNQITQS